MATFPHRKPPKARHMERRPGFATERFRAAFDGPLDADAPLAPEALERARAARRRHAERYSNPISPDGESIGFALLVGIVALLALVAGLAVAFG